MILSNIAARLLISQIQLCLHRKNIFQQNIIEDFWKQLYQAKYQVQQIHSNPIKRRKKETLYV